MRFQSTLPARGATVLLAARGEELRISIHAPREGSDMIASNTARLDMIFQSTLPARGATILQKLVHRTADISIHAPREGSDVRGLRPAGSLPISIHAPREGSDLDQHLHLPGVNDFNPRSPRGERQQMCTNIHLQACKTSIKFNLAPQKPSNHTALILRKKGAVLVRSSQVMYGH